MTGFDPYATGDVSGNPPLWLALLQRDLRAAKLLLDAGERVDDVLEIDGNSFLHRAAQQGDREFVRFLLAHGADRSLRTFDYVANTPLHWAAREGHADIVCELMAAGADVNAKNDARCEGTPIQEAVEAGHAEVVALLLRAGADPTVPGGMAITAVDQAHYHVAGGLDGPNARAIQALLAKWPSRLRDRPGRD